jgi:hypothetical protein
MDDSEVLLRFSKAEALVLFEWLANLDSAPPPFSHPSEEKVLWRIEAQLESILVEPFAPNYKDLLSQARRTVDLARHERTTRQRPPF